MRQGRQIQFEQLRGGFYQIRGVYMVIYGTLLIHPLPTSRVSCLQEGQSRVDDDDDDGEDCGVDDDEDDDDDEYYYGENRTEFAIKVV